MAIAPVHGVGAGRKWLSLAAPVRCVAGRFAVDHIGRDCEHRLGVQCVAIGREFAQLVHEGADQPRGEIVDPIVVVAEQRELALGLIVGDEAGFVPFDLHLGIFDRREAVGDDGHAGDAERHGTHGSIIVQRHLNPLVGVFVMHVVDDVHGADICARQPVHDLLEPLDDIVEVQIISLDGLRRGRNLLARDFVAAAVDCVKQGLGEIGAGAEELHLLAHCHW